jgi:hypothetical protein
MLPRVAPAQCLGQFHLWFKTKLAGALQPRMEEGEGSGKWLFGEVALKLRLGKTTLPWPVPSISWPCDAMRWTFSLCTLQQRNTRTDSSSRLYVRTVIVSSAIKRRTRRGQYSAWLSAGCVSKSILLGHVAGGVSWPMTLQFMVRIPLRAKWEERRRILRSGGVQDASLAALVKGCEVSTSASKTHISRGRSEHGGVEGTFV